MLKEVSKGTFIYLLIRAGKCTASHVAGVQGNSVFFGCTVIIKTQFEKRTLIVKSPVTELLFLLARSSLTTEKSESKFFALIMITSGPLIGSLRFDDGNVNDNATNQ